MTSQPKTADQLTDEQRATLDEIQLELEWEDPEPAPVPKRDPNLITARIFWEAHHLEFH